MFNYTSYLTRILTFWHQSLLAHNAKVYIGARSQAKAEEAISELRELTGKEALFLRLDLGDLKAVKTAAEEFLRYYTSSLR